MSREFRHKKELGQHFLQDRNIAAKIARTGEISSGDPVWEIGPGRGILTREILEFTNRVTAFEIDKMLYKDLEKEFKKKLKLVKQDVLKANWDELYTGKPVKVIANIPYQITTPLLMKLIGFREKIDQVVLMIQREVALRLNAVPSTKDYSFLSIKAQFYFDIRYEFTVKPHVFFPPPNVQSAVVSLIPKKEVPQLADEEHFWRIVDVCLRSRRKTLRNNLKYMFSKEQVAAINEQGIIDLKRRAETLTIEEFIKLYEAVK